MGLKIARFFSLQFVALVLAPALAHLLELPNKIGLSRNDTPAVSLTLDPLACRCFGRDRTSAFGPELPYNSAQKQKTPPRRGFQITDSVLS